MEWVENLKTQKYKGTRDENGKMLGEGLCSAYLHGERVEKLSKMAN